MKQQRYQRMRTFMLPAALIALLLWGRAGPAAGLAAAAPVLDLNGEADGINYQLTYTEDEGAKIIVAAGLAIDNGTDTTLTGARAVLAVRPDGALETLSADPGATGLGVVYSSVTGELTITGSSSVANYQTVLRSLSYSNLSQSPDIPDRVVTVTVSDGPLVSGPATSTIAINSVNDAPVLDNTGDMTLTPIDEDNFTSNGNSVMGIIASAEQSGENRITDVDKGAQEGMAIIEAEMSNGVWQYSLDAGATWQTFPAVSNSAALLLNGAARIRFVPAAGYNGTADFTFRAWDLSAGQLGTTADASINGGVSAFSAQAESATISILSVNDLPLIDLNGSAAGLDFTTQFFRGGPPVVVADVTATVSDADHPQLIAMVLTLLKRPDGNAEGLAVSTDGTNVKVVPYDPATGQLVLNGPAPLDQFQLVLRKVTYFNNKGAPKTVDRPVQTVAGDGIGSSTPAVTTIKMNPPNHAPVLNSAVPLALADVAEDTLQPAGKGVAQILAPHDGGDPITDGDLNALEGIAVIGADNGNGDWQYSLANPPAGEADWQAVGVVSNTAALLLSDAAWLRFTPKADFSGAAGALTIRAWDQTSGNNGQRDVDVSVNGDSTAFSIATGSVTANVTPVNDPPTFSGLPNGPLVYTEDAAAILLMPGVIVKDVDSPNLVSAEIRLTNALDGDAEWLTVTTAGTAITSSFEGGVLRLSGNDSVANYQKVLASARYQNASQDPTAAERLLKLSAADGQGSGPASDLRVQVQPLNDPPELDLDGVGPGTDYEAVFYINRGPASIVASSMTAVDIDDTSLKSATIRIVGVKNAHAEILSVDLAGTSNIKRNYDAVTGMLNLTGVDSVANYQRVLRTITYNNILPQPNTTDRVVEFTLFDSVSAGVKRRTVVHLLPAPTVHLYLPLAPGRVDEPNNVCAQAVSVFLNRDEPFYANDRDDWYFFSLTEAAEVTVELRNFTPGKGQLLVASGQRCSGLQLIGNNGENRQDKVIRLGVRPAGRYYIWIINDGPFNTTTPYHVYIRTVAP